MAEATGRLVYRPTLTRVLAVIYLALGVWLLVGAPVSAGPAGVVGRLGWLVAAGTLVYALLWRPAVIVDPSGVRLVNVVRTVHVPWPALETVDTRYTLTLTAGGRRFASWAATAPGRTGALLQRVTGQGGRAGAEGEPSVLPDPRWLPGRTGVDRSSRDLRSGSGAAAFMVEQGWMGWRDRPRPAGDVASGDGRSEPSGDGLPGGGQPDGVVRVRWSLPVIAVGLLGLVAGVLAPALG